MLIGWLTAGIADLNPSLTDVYRNDFTHRLLEQWFSSYVESIS
jgi:hypothetical protein